MKFTQWLIPAFLLAVGLMQMPGASAVTIGQIDDFEDGTTQGWSVGLLGATHPAPPANIPNGGPTGVGDNYLQLTAVGGIGAGNRLTVINLAQWAGDYTTVGVGAIAMDLRNLGTTDLTVRLYFEDPKGGPPLDAAVTTTDFVLPAGGGWTHVEFAIDPLSLTTLAGDVNTLLSDVTALRIFHSSAANFPGPPIAALLGVDNITAQAALTVPEPGALTWLGLALLAPFVLRRRTAARLVGG